MRVGVYVGSFNPPHNGHESIVNFLISHNYVDKVLVIPTGNYWDKQNIVSLEDRVNMLKYLESNNVIVNSDLSKYEYSYQILSVLNENYNDEFYLIIGADNVKDFYKWKNVEEILKNHIIVIPRDGINVYEYLENYEEKDKFIVVDNFISKDISSTYIRECIRENRFDSLEKIMNKNVIMYIKDNNLYKEND